MSYEHINTFQQKEKRSKKEKGYYYYINFEIFCLKIGEYFIVMRLLLTCFHNDLQVVEGWRV